MSDGFDFLSKYLPLESHQILFSGTTPELSTGSLVGNRYVSNRETRGAELKIDLHLKLIVSVLTDLKGKVGVLGRTGLVVWRDPSSILLGGSFSDYVSIMGLESAWSYRVQGTPREGSSLVLEEKIGSALFHRLESELARKIPEQRSAAPVILERIVYLSPPDPTGLPETRSMEAKSGRPSRHKEVLETYERQFPNGHGNVAWKEVHRALGIDISLDTLKRALGRRK